MASHMGVQTFATARNSQVEILVHYVFQRFIDHLISIGEVTDAQITVQKDFTSAIANDIWDLFVLARRADGVAIELWCQTTCYKGNKTGRPEPNKTYEVRETLVEALSIREHFVDTPTRLFRSVHVTVGDPRYTYQWFMDLKSACFDKSLYMNQAAGKLPEGEITAEWTAPRFEAVDPLKDIQADILAVRAGVMTLKEAIARQGYDPAQVLAEIAATNAELDVAGITLDTDPRRSTKTGQEKATPSDMQDPVVP